MQVKYGGVDDPFPTPFLTFRVLDNPTGPEDFTVAITFSLKAFPHYGFGSDIVRPASLLGG
jgi:hypothetical protein